MKKYLSLSVLLALTVLILMGCSSEKQLNYISDSNMKFGTVINIKLYDYNDSSFFEKVWAEMDRMENLYSTNIATSDVSKFNAHQSTEPLSVSPEIIEMVTIAQTYSELSNGQFDITIEPLVKAWDILAENPRVPDAALIEESQLHINYKNLIVDKANHTLAKKDPMLKIDLGAIAKGYAADQLAKLIKANGIQRAILNLGGNIFAVGSKGDDTPWSIGIQDPYEPTGESFGLIKTSDMSIVTSGSYERYFEQDGKRYHHILNPETGYPSDNELVAVTIISKESVVGDCLSTSAFSLGLEAGMSLIENQKGISAIFVTKDKSVYFVGDAKKTFVLKKDGYTLKE